VTVLNCTRTVVVNHNPDQTGDPNMARRLTTFARILRKQSTDVERKFWNEVRHSRLGGFKFKRQYSIGPYIVDFICTEARLVVELDGGQHADNVSDQSRDAYLGNAEYKVLRFWNTDVMTNIEGVLTMVLKELEQRARSASS
jgi:very-short-patch-repair endonuclease